MTNHSLPSYLQRSSAQHKLNKAKRRTEAKNPPKPIWQPQPGPQALGYHSLADEIFYGGAAGGGKTDLLLGLAGTAHRQSILFRREFPRLRSVIERSKEIYSAHGTYNESLHIWRLPGGRTIEFAGLQYEADRENYRGRPHDLYAWDELPEFSETQFRFVNGWLRTTFPGQRCRIAGAGNPPTDAQGEWVISYWGPWLDSQHSNPAQPGELRWFARIDDRDVEVESGEPFEYKSEMIQPRSRTFIPALLDDNPILEATGYRAILQGMPEPLRSQLLKGDFSTGHQDDRWQCIPSEWVIAAQERWANMERPDLAMRAVGVDVARGGQDNHIVQPLYGTYFDEPAVHPGESTPDGATGARYVTEVLGDQNPPVCVDVIGYGSSVYDHLKAMPNMRAYPVNNAAGSSATDKTGRYDFVNIRAEDYWKIREALDPDSGENIALPPIRQLRVDLCAPRYKIVGARIQIESKEDIIKRTGRSPDYGDAVVLAWHGARQGPLVLFEM